PGFQSVSRTGQLIHDASGKFEDAFRNVRDAAESALASLRGGDLDPDAVELEFGVKLNAAAGAVIAKTSVEGHLKVKLTWGRPRPEGPETRWVGRRRAAAPGPRSEARGTREGAASSRAVGPRGAERSRIVDWQWRAWVGRPGA